MNRELNVKYQLPPGGIKMNPEQQEFISHLQEKTRLLSLVNALSKSNSKQDLFQVIVEDIKLLFPFDAVSVCISDEQRNTIYEVLDGRGFPDSIRKKLIAEKALGPWAPGNFPSESWWMHTNKFPVIRSVEEEISLDSGKRAGAEQLKTAISFGLQHLIGGALSVNHQKIGAICFFSKTAARYGQDHIGLFNDISAQIAIALANVIAQEEMIEKEREKEGLVKVMEAISRVSSRDKLLKIIFSHIQPLFPFDAAGLYVINEDKDEIYEIASGSVFTDDAEEMPVKQPDAFFGKYSHSNKKNWWCTDEEVIINDLQTEAQYAKGYLGEDQFRLGVLYGLKHMIGGPLLFNGRKIGAVCFNSSIENFYTRKDIEKFKIISEQLAIAVGKILYIEEIVEKNREKSILFSISESIVRIDDRKKLFETIFTQIKPLIPFDDIAIIVVNDDKSMWCNWAVADVLLDTEANRRLHQSGSAGYYPIDAVIRKSLREVGICSIDQWVKSGNVFAPELEQAGLKNFLFAPLQYHGECVGAIFFESCLPAIYSEKYFEIIRIIADIIAAAVNTIIARNEMLERAREKADLLSISNEINCIKDLNSIIDWLQTKMKQLVGADYTMLTLINEKKNRAYFVLSEATAEWQLQATGSARKGIIDAGVSYAGSFFEYLENLPDGQVYRLAEVPEHVTHIPVDFCNNLNIKESFAVKLTYKGEKIGHLCIHATEENRFKHLNISMLKNVVNQVSIALENILNHEELLEREKQKDLAISINNAVLLHESFSDVMGAIAASINAAISCDICYIRVMSQNIDPRPFQFFCEKKEGKFSVRPVEDKVADTGLTPQQAGRNAEQFLTTMENATILSGEDLEALIPRYQYLQVFSQRIGIRSFIFMPLYLRYNCVAYLILGSKTPYAYIDSDLEIVKSVRAQLSLTMDNRLAFHQIHHLKEMLETENSYLQEELHENYNFNEIVGTSDALKIVFSQAGMVADTDSTVLITGETGTGKELVARAIHKLSDRKDKPMVKVNCACLPSNLIESELFGHEKGAFTGAIERRIGKFELANGGTIFLDEIGELPLDLQAKLLRVLQEKEFERLGGKSTLRTDIRIIAATNKDLLEETQQKRFRSDLYYRLNVFPIFLPALRDRKEDIPLLAMHFARKIGQRMRKNITAIHNDTLQEMMVYDWPGNIRELEHVIEHSVICSKSSKLILSKPLLAGSRGISKSLAAFRIQSLKDQEREHILQVLRHCKGKIRGLGGAAQLLDINPNTLESRMKKLGIKKEHVHA